MELEQILRDIHRLNHGLERFERKYGVMSATFYEAYKAGEEPEDDAWMLDFQQWAGLYEVWRDRQQAYALAVERLRQEQTPLSKMIHAAA
jgi:hypothetical protein